MSSANATPPGASHGAPPPSPNATAPPAAAAPVPGTTGAAPVAGATGAAPAPGTTGAAPAPGTTGAAPAPGATGAAGAAPAPGATGAAPAPGISPGSAPAVDGWFTTGDRPALLGSRCAGCRTVFFPRETAFCRNPGCTSERFDEVELSRLGRVWSYTDARYQPPPPYIPRVDPYEPFALAAVELEAEGIVVLGQVADGFGVDDLTVGAPVELVVEPLYLDDEGTERTIWRWRPVPATPAGSTAAAATPAAATEEGAR